MTPVDRDAWEAANRAYLAAAIAELRARLEPPAHDGDGSAVPTPGGIDPSRSGADSAAPSALDLLVEMFGLTSFERELVLLCAASELDGEFAAMAAALPGAAPGGEVTFALALALLPDSHWSALSPSAPLRRWRLVEVGAAGSVVNAPLRIDERILHYLAGVNGADERLLGLLSPVGTAGFLADSHRSVAERVRASWPTANAAGTLPVIQLIGTDYEAMRLIAATGMAGLGIGAALLRARDIPASSAERETLGVLVQREAALAHTAILIEFDSEWAGDAGHAAALVDSLTAPVVLLSAETLRLPISAPTFRLSVGPLSESEQRSLWREALGETADKLNGQLDQVLQQFRLDSRAIRSAGAEVLASLGNEAAPKDLLWRTCRTQLRARLDDLGARIRPRADWSSLVLPESQMRLLREIALQMRQRSRVYGEWGFEKQCNRGLGISALFSGPSGTGKTMAAEVLANELDLDLYRIDLSQVVSKYIGETEKNLRRVFDAAENAGAILLFDEADALFGKRSEVKDSHDRYANIEIGYLLQRMEEYRGIAILTTNLKDALDRAFLRRIRFVVAFPFPDAQQRALIWERIFPPETPTSGLDIARLARLNVAGGNIRNIAMNAAFLAADRNAPVTAEDVLRAARHEYGKLDRKLTDSELRGWA
jgi:hypothetical protein